MRDFILILLIVSIVGLGFMDMPIDSLPLFLLPFSIGWWVRSNIE